MKKILIILFLSVCALLCFAEDALPCYYVDEENLSENTKLAFNLAKEKKFNELSLLVKKNPILLKQISAENMFIYRTAVVEKDVNQINALLNIGFPPFYYDMAFEGFRTVVFDILHGKKDTDFFKVVFEDKKLFDYKFYKDFQKKGLIAIDSNMDFSDASRFYNYDSNDLKFIYGEYIDLFRYLVDNNLIDFTKYWKVKGIGEEHTGYLNLSHYFQQNSDSLEWIKYLKEKNFPINIVSYGGRDDQQQQGRTFFESVSYRKEFYDGLKKLGCLTMDEIIKNYSTLNPKPVLMKCKITDDAVRLREKPNLQCTTIAKLYNGNIVGLFYTSNNSTKIDGEEYHWFYVVTDDDKIGWVYGKYIEPVTNKWIDILP